VKVGDKVYRVITDDPEEGIEVQERTIAKLTAKMCKLDRPFSFCSSTHGLIARGLLGRLFFATPGEALDDLRRKALRNKEQAQRELGRAEATLEWCYGNTRKYP
jgi:hypothetical protein